MAKWYASEPQDVDDGYGTSLVTLSLYDQGSAAIDFQAFDFTHAIEVWLKLNGDPDGLCNYKFSEATDQPFLVVFGGEGATQ